MSFRGSSARGRSVACTSALLTVSADSEAARAHAGGDGDARFRAVAERVRRLRVDRPVGNQTPLNAARLPFATYLNGMHNRVHPVFLAALTAMDALPRKIPDNDPTIFTRLEVVLHSDGRIVKMGVIRTSGFAAFDIAALDAFNRADPFGESPAAIRSSGGRVYLH